MAKSDNKLEKININHSVYTTRLNDKFRNKVPYSPPDKSRLLSFIPGTIIELMVKEGDEVKKGDVVMVLEAMKMKNRLKCQVSGTVKRVHVKPGDNVPRGTLLMEINMSEQ